MKIRIALWALPLLGILTMPAMAQHDRKNDYRYDRFEQRLDKQHRRIKQGIRSGELTKRETQRLRKQQRHIARLMYQFKHDGYLDRYEQRKLHRKLNKASDRIYLLKHNRSHRGAGSRTYGHKKYNNREWSAMLKPQGYF